MLHFISPCPIISLAKNISFPDGIVKLPIGKGFKPVEADWTTPAKKQAVNGNGLSIPPL